MFITFLLSGNTKVYNIKYQIRIIKNIIKKVYINAFINTKMLKKLPQLVHEITDLKLFYR